MAIEKVINPVKLAFPSLLLVLSFGVAFGQGPGGSTGNIQYNNAGSFGGAPVNVTSGGLITLKNGLLAGRADVYDLAADYGVKLDYNGTTGTDNCTALTAAFAAHPQGRFYLPYGVAYSSCSVLMQPGSQLFGVAFAYNPDSTHNYPFTGVVGLIGSSLLFASGVDGIHRQTSSVVHDINIVGMDPAPRLATDTALAIVPDGQYLPLYTEAPTIITSTVRTSNVVTATINSIVPNWFRAKGIMRVSGAFPSDLNGTFYVTSSQQVGNTSTITWNQVGSNESATTQPSIMPGTTGTKHSSGMIVEGSQAFTENVSISNFANNCFEVNPGPSNNFISDDTNFEKSSVEGCRGAGLAILGGSDTSKGHYSHILPYFNMLYGVNAASFLGDTFIDFNASYNALSATGLNAGTSITLTTCSSSAGLLTCQSSSAHGLSNGNGAIIAGTSQTPHNLPVTGSLSCWIANVPDTTHFTCRLPSNTSSVTSTGGTVQLPGFSALYTGLGVDVGGYAIGRQGLAGHNLAIGLYEEGGQTGQNPGGCGAYFNSTVLLLHPHAGDAFCGGSKLATDATNGMTLHGEQLTMNFAAYHFKDVGDPFSTADKFTIDGPTGRTLNTGGYASTGFYGVLTPSSIAMYYDGGGTGAIMLATGPDSSTIGNVSLIGQTANGSVLSYLLNTSTGSTFGVPVRFSPGSTPISSSIAYAPTLTPSLVPAASCSNQAIAVAGLLTTDSLSQITPPSALGNVSLSGYASAANTLTVHFCNVTNASVTPPSGAYGFRATH